MNTVFLTNEEGLTSTSANHLANIAKEACKEFEQALENVSFVNVDLQLISSNETHSYSKGLTSTSELNSMIKKIADLKAFCAWVREAIKYKDMLLTTTNDLSIEDYEKLTHTECPAKPKSPTLITDEDVIKNMTVKERNNYLRLEALAATYGSYIHPGGKIAEARDTMYKYINTPTETKGSGRDMVLYYRAASLDPKEVESAYMELQASHRDYEKQLNAIKFKIKEEVARVNRELNAAYKKELETYNVAYSKFLTEFQTYMINSSEEISALKIVIPEKLKPIYEYLESL